MAGRGFAGASLPPDAADLVGSLRAFGYGLADALGDLVDNSVAADAGKVSVEFSSDVWRRLDAGLEGPALARKLGEAGQQLGVLFHRQIGAGALEIRLGGRRVPPWDPFLLHHPATQDLGTEILEHGEVRAKVHPVVLPHPGRLHPRELKAASGPRGMIAHQGFYVYRGGRLLQAGGWLGLPGLPMTPLTRLARLAVDFDTADDLAWAVDVRKASIRPPGVLERRLTQLAEHARGVSERVFTHRGGRQVESPGGHAAAVWRQYQLGGRTGYLINRLHPLVASALRQPTPGRLEAVLRLAEVTLPVRLIAQEAVTDAAADRGAGADMEEDEIRATLRQVLTALPAEGTERVELLRGLAATDPFVRYPALVAEIIDSDSPQGA